MGRIICYGSLNIDQVYQLSHFVRPGETLAASAYQVGAGGKGANQAVAAAKAGARVRLAGKVGRDGDWLLQKLKNFGVDTTGVRKDDALFTGQAVIQVTPEGENAIIITGGANMEIAFAEIESELAAAAAEDILLLQNEINRLDELMTAAAAKKLPVAFNFAPFDPAASAALPLELVEYLILNETEAAGLSGKTELKSVLGALRKRYPATHLVLTLGAAGALIETPAGETIRAASPRVEVVDTTAAGDTFVGYFLTARLQGEELPAALELACRAASLTVTRSGATDSIPTAAEVAEFFRGQ